tara:strand:+ start:119 stop:385 length:267 start_codon:yes stop_codon:yes gene_type:complete
MDKTAPERLKRRVEREILFSLHDYIIGMIPEPVRKIVGWILLIFGAVVLLRVYPGSLFFELADQMFMITFFVGMFSFAYGIILLRHKG